MTIDPVTLAVIKGGLEEVTEEMDSTLVRTAFSPAMCESRDRADGIYRADIGSLVVQGKTGMPAFIATMQFTVQSLIEILKTREVSPGDIFMANDPYLGGTHLMDIKFIKPFFYKGELLCFLANAGHWSDMGGSVPGGFAAQATEIYQEGIQIPPVKLFTKGKLNKDVEDILLRNIRVPRERQGDLRANINALFVGDERLTKLLERYGRDTVMDCIIELEDRSERMMRSRIEEISDGFYNYTDYMDSDGVVNKQLEIHLEIEVKGSDMLLDFSKSSPPCRGPLNSVLATTKAGIYIGIMHLFPDLYINGGMLKPFKFNVPTTTFLNATYPAPVSGCAAEVMSRVTDCLFGALHKAIPDIVSAAQHSSANNLTIGGYDPKKGHYIMYLFSGGGYGGHKKGDGLAYGNSSASTSRTTSIEVYEQRAPILYRRFTLREGSGGPGKNRGGLSGIVEFELLRGYGYLSFLGDRGKMGPFGIFGGKPGAKARYSWFKRGKRYFPPHVTKAEKILLEEGDRVLVETPGGGGYGNPFERDPEAVLMDVKGGYITTKSAKEDYGVMIEKRSNGLRINYEETNKIRKQNKTRKN
jgi:N-methylhydantoinase B